MVFSTINRPSTMPTEDDAYFRGYDLVVVEDGCEAFSEEDHQDGLDYLEQVYGAYIMATGTTIDR